MTVPSDTIQKLLNDKIIVFDDEIGEWVFWPTSNQGHYSDRLLAEIVSYLKEVNAEEYLKQNPDENDG